MRCVVMVPNSVALIAAVMVLGVVTQETGISECEKVCTADRNCTENAFCLCQESTCENRTCTCGPNFMRNQSDPSTCYAKKRYTQECLQTDECATWFARCTEDETGLPRCLCPTDHMYDSAKDECTNAPPCPIGPSYIYSAGEKACHKVLTACENCIDIAGKCALDVNWGNAEAKTLNNSYRESHFIKTLWSYEFYRASSPPVTILLSINQSSEPEWFWPNGQPVTQQISQSMMGNKHCLYLEYDGDQSRLKADNNCNLTSTNIACTIKLPPAFCGPSYDSYGTLWSFTEAGTIATHSCREGYEGIVRRECTTSGTFERPYYNCTSTVVKEISKQLSSGTLTTTEALEVLSTGLTSDEAPMLFTGDLLRVGETLAIVAELSKNETVDNTTADKFLDVASFLIDPANDQAWESVKQENDEGAEKLLSTVDQYVEQLAVTVQAKSETVTIIKPNIELQVKVLNTGDESNVDNIVFPSETPVTQVVVDRAKTSTLFLDKSAFTDPDFKITSASSLLYKNLSASLSNRRVRSDGKEDKETEVKSQVLSLSLYPKPPPVLTPPLVLNFIPFEEILPGYEVKCSYWDSTLLNGNGAWSSAGCRSVMSNATSIQCECNHLTNFALLISPVRPSAMHEEILRYLSYVGCGVSMLFIAITIVYYIYYWRFLKSDNATMTFALCVTLLLAYIIFIAGVDRTENKNACTVVAVILHYIYLVVFFVMLSEGLHMLTMVAMVYDRKSYVKHFLIASFVMPAVIVGISMAASLLEGYGDVHYCWLPPGKGVFWAFAGPVLAIIVTNLVIATLIMKKLCSTTAMKNKNLKDKVRLSTWTLCVLVPIMGVTWLFGIFSVSEDTVVWQYVFVVLNALQGFGIFVFHCVLNKQLRAAIEASKERKRTLQEFSTELKNRVVKYKEASSEMPVCTTATDLSTLQKKGKKGSDNEMTVVPPNVTETSMGGIDYTTQQNIPETAEEGIGTSTTKQNKEDKKS